MTVFYLNMRIENKPNLSSNKSKIFHGILIFFLITTVIIMFFYSYSQSRDKDNSIKPNLTFGSPVFDPTKDYYAQGVTLKDRVSRTNRIALVKLKTITARISSIDKKIFNAGEFDIRYGGVVSDVSYNSDSEDSALRIVINNIKEEYISYTATFSKKQAENIQVFLNKPNEASIKINISDIEAGDLINIYETIYILDTEREDLVAIEIQKVL